MADQTSHYNVEPIVTRRQMLQRCGTGLGSLGLASLMASEGMLNQAAGASAGSPTSPMAPKMAHFPGKAKHVIHIFLNGGASQVDTFDPKPALAKYAGKKLPMENLRTERKTGASLPSPFKFKKYGESGLEVSELFSELGECVDDIAFVRSMYTNVPNHEPSLMMMNCGDLIQPRPSMGAWVTYGLGTENQNLPGFVVMCPGGYPITESANWRSAFLPGAYQGTHIDTKHTDIEKLISNIKNKQLALPEQRRQLDLLQALNRRHQAVRSQESALESRIQSFELAYRMQMQASDVFDVNNEPKHIHE
ncbi:MAG TPA: DUF1501 domain-containing protein, partial [Planctomycetaceae bacterium]|nr:DUF1501 domain-containing protein [Planctomycetaceae bacterium]